MHIGLTYDLRSEYLAAGYSEEETAEFDRPDTIDAIEGALHALGHTTDRVGNARQLVHRLAAGDHWGLSQFSRHGGQEDQSSVRSAAKMGLSPSRKRSSAAGDRWDLVFNIAEGLHGTAREAQIPAILDVYDIPYTFSDPLVLAVGLDKGLSKLAVREAGLPTPDFAVLRRLADLEAVDLPLPLFAKPVAEGTGKGITAASKIERPADLWPMCEDLLRRFPQGVLLESFLPGRELTVGVLGTGEDARVLGTLEIVLRGEAEPDVYSYVNKERCEELVEYRLVHAAADPEVAEAEAVALKAWRVLGCRDGGRVDLRSDAAGRPSFLEVNPLAGLHPEHSDLPMLCTAMGIAYIELIREIVESAAGRVKTDRSSGSRLSPEPLAK